MSTTHRYQVMPDLSPEERAALKADIAANGVRIRKEVDEEGNTIDGHQRQQICDELGMKCPERVLVGLTEAQKLEHAWQVNVARRQLSSAQKRQLAKKLWHDALTQERIAQLLGVSQSTVANWVRKFINSDKLPHALTAQGKDGKQYPRTKTQRPTAQQTQETNSSETPQISSDMGDEAAQAPEQQEPPKPRDSHAEAQSPSSEPPGASDVPDAPESPSLVSDEWHTVPGEQPISPLGSTPALPAENDAEARWADALQDLSARLEILRVQGLRPLSTPRSPETMARGMATIERMQEMLIELAAVVGAEMAEASIRNGHDVGATPFPVPPPVADAAQEHGMRELVTVSSTEDRVGDAADGDQLPSQGHGEGSPSREPGLPVQEEERGSAEEPLVTSGRVTRGRNRKGSPARTRTRRSNAKGLAASAMGELTESIPGASGTIAEISGCANEAAPVEPCSPDMLSTNRCPDHDCPEPSSGSQEVCLDEASQLNSHKPMGRASAGILPTAHVPAAASVAPLTLCPECSSSNTWLISGANGSRPGRFACFACQYHFDTRKPGDVPSTQSQVSSHKIVQVASEEKPEDSSVRDRQQSLPAPVLVTDPLTQDGIDPGPSEATVSSTAGGGAFGDEDTAYQAPPAGPQDDGETYLHECREIA